MYLRTKVSDFCLYFLEKVVRHVLYRHWSIQYLYWDFTLINVDVIRNFHQQSFVSRTTIWVFCFLLRLGLLWMMNTLLKVTKVRSWIKIPWSRSDLKAQKDQIRSDPDHYIKYYVWMLVNDIECWSRNPQWITSEAKFIIHTQKTLLCAKNPWSYRTSPCLHYYTLSVPTKAFFLFF